MKDTLGNRVRFEIDRLFNGAVDVDWLQNDSDKASRAARAFVFHGPGTHGVAASVTEGTGHRLVDTATFAADIASDLANPGSRPFTLAIASYGSGKSHLAVTLSELFSDPGGKTAQAIMANITTADSVLATRIESSMREIDGPVLVLTVNGMNNADLASVLLMQLKERIAADGHSVEPLESLRQRFHIAATMLGRLSPELTAAFVKDVGGADVEECRDRLLAFDESLYDRAQAFFRTIGLPIQTIGDETVKDVLGKVASEYIGQGKPYARLLILFDEFGHYLEFAANKPQIAGDGALQHLFEGVQAHSDAITFVGFVQFELKAYLQRLANMSRNEANRYVTRYDSAEKYYLSSNLETLSVFDERARQGKTDFVEKYRDIDPPWDPGEAYDNLVGLCRKRRARESKAWISAMEAKYADPSGFSPEETLAALEELARRIPAFNPKDAPKLAHIEKALAKHRENLGVDLLVAQFNALSPTAKKQFLAKIKKLS